MKLLVVLRPYCETFDGPPREVTRHGVTRVVPGGGATSWFHPPMPEGMSYDNIRHISTGNETRPDGNHLAERVAIVEGPDDLVREFVKHPWVEPVSKEWVRKNLPKWMPGRMFYCRFTGKPDPHPCWSEVDWCPDLGTCSCPRECDLPAEACGCVERPLG